MTFRTPAAALSLACLSAATLLLTAADAHAVQATPFGATAHAERIDLEFDPFSGQDITIYQGQNDPDPAATIPATSATAAAVGPKTLSTAHASLSTGILRASAVASVPDTMRDVQASSTARIWETFSFQNTNALGVVQPITITVDGNISNGSNGSSKALLFCTTGDITEGRFLQSGTNTYDFFFVVPAGQTTQYFQLDLELTAYRDASLDFSHTVTVSFAPVEGLTYSSASGTFLSAVPEPASLSLLLLAAPLAARRRR